MDSAAALEHHAARGGALASPANSPTRLRAAVAGASDVTAATSNGGARSPDAGPGSSNGTRSKRNRSIAGLDSSPGSIDDNGDGDGDGIDDRRRTPGVKRACNECRQQKLRCDVIQEPWQPCSRCRRLQLDCRIQSNFKRVGKRSKNAEMELEIVELRRQLASTQAHLSPSLQKAPVFSLPSASDSVTSEMYSSPTQHHIPSHTEAVVSLLDLKQGLDSGAAFLKPNNGLPTGAKKLGNIVLTAERAIELFNDFFTFYHPFLPLLDPEKPADHYFETCPLLYWTIISTAARRFQPDKQLLANLAPELSKLIWSTLGDVPQSYHVVKALCLLCTWPLPINSTSSDPTFMLSGVMMQVALQIGLHRPSHAQDFTKFHIQLRDDELKDRVKTWAACNIVAQSVGTGYGQPPSTLYDWTLQPSADKEPSYRLSEDLETRLRIEKFCDKVTKSLYSNTRDPVGLANDSARASVSSLLEREFDELELVTSARGSQINVLHLRAAELHLHLSAFFSPPTSSVLASPLSSNATTYHLELQKLYHSTISFLNCCSSLETISASGGALSYASNYILQMTIAAGFTLLKLLNSSSFSRHINLTEGKEHFSQCIWAIRRISVQENDLPSRLAEVLAQLWKYGSQAMATRSAIIKAESTSNGRSIEGHDEDDDDRGLMLKVRCRMSMSLVYDSVWRWRQEFQAKGRGNLDSAVKNPTNPDSITGEEISGASSISSANAALDSGMHSSSENHSVSLLPPGTSSTLQANPTLVAAAGTTGPRSITPNGLGAPGLGGINTLAESSYEVWDPLNWVLDGFVDFPYSFNAGGMGMAGEAGGLV